MCKTKLRSFLNNQVKSFETLKEKHSLSFCVSLTHIPHSGIKNYLKKKVEAFKLYKIN